MAIKSKTQLASDISGSTFTAPQKVILDDIVDSYEDIFAQVTTVQRDALTPTAGLIVYNTDNDRYEYWNGLIWVGIGQDLQTPMTVKVDLSSAEILALDSVPKVLVAAPGSGYAIAPIALTARYTYGSAAYAGTFTAVFVKATSKTTANYFFNIAKAGVLNQTANKSGISNSFGTTALDALVENDSIELEADGTVTTGDGTLTVWLTYSLIDY